MTAAAQQIKARAAAAWDAYNWPAWVPDRTREEVRRFWESRNDPPERWQDNARENNAPPLFARHTGPAGFSDRADRELAARGRYVHCWNNIGRLVLDDGSWEYTSFGRWDVPAQHGPDPLGKEIDEDSGARLWNGEPLLLGHRGLPEAAEILRHLYPPSLVDSAEGFHGRARLGRYGWAYTSGPGLPITVFTMDAHLANA